MKTLIDPYAVHLASSPIYVEWVVSAPFRRYELRYRPDSYWICFQRRVFR